MKLLLTIVLAMCVCLGSYQVRAAAPQALAPIEIQSIHTDVRGGSINIYGAHFDNGYPPVVTIGRFPVIVTEFTASHILGELPSEELIPDGDYLLVIKTGVAPQQNASLSLTINNLKGSLALRNGAGDLVGWLIGEHPNPNYFGHDYLTPDGHVLTVTFGGNGEVGVIPNLTSHVYFSNGSCTGTAYLADQFFTPNWDGYSKWVNISIGDKGRIFQIGRYGGPMFVRIERRSIYNGNLFMSSRTTSGQPGCEPYEDHLRVIEVDVIDDIEDYGITWIENELGTFGYGVENPRWTVE